MDVFPCDILNTDPPCAVSVPRSLCECLVGAPVIPGGGSVCVFLFKTSVTPGRSGLAPC